VEIHSDSVKTGYTRNAVSLKHIKHTSN